jgi:putative peptide zinc metalloprotease protein
LVEGRSAAKACLGEIDRASLTAVRMPIDALLRLLGKSRLLASLWAAVICSLLLTLMIAAIADPVSRSLDLHMLVLDRKVMPLSAWLIVGGLASVFLHELSHCLIAATFGLREGQFRVQLIYGLFPSLTLKLKGLYTLSESRRMMVWSAGVVTNVGIVSTLLLIERRFGDSPLLHWTLSVNWWLAIINLIPFLPTDGYFFAATLLKEPNIRVRSWSWLLHPWSKPSQALSVFVIGYGVGTVALILFTIWARCRAILHAHSNHPLEWMVPAAVLLASLFVVGRLVRNNLANTESV